MCPIALWVLGLFGSACQRRTPPQAALCGNMRCLEFEHPDKALEYVLANSPRILAVGETHALKSAGPVLSATHRFTSELLPLLKGKSKHIVIELLTPAPDCAKPLQTVTEQQKPVTESQAETNQQDFLALGFAAKKLGIQPIALQPTCDEYTKIASGGEAGLALMLELITQKASQKLEELHTQSSPSEILLAYGGALHNNLTPQKGQETWSFGPKLAQISHNRYTELDLIVPEFIKDTPVWRAQPWYLHYKPERKPHKTLLFEMSPHCYALIFPPSHPTPSPQE